MAVPKREKLENWALTIGPAECCSSDELVDWCNDVMVMMDSTSGRLSLDTEQLSDDMRDCSDCCDMRLAGKRASLSPTRVFVVKSPGILETNRVVDE